MKKKTSTKRKSSNGIKRGVKGTFKILLEDISFSIYGFSCKKIKRLNKEQHNKLSDELSSIGKSVFWTNTEEMNYLNVAWVNIDGTYKIRERKAICKILNCL